MRTTQALAFGFILVALAACAPQVQTVTPTQAPELVTAYPFSESFAAVVNVINTQPFPSDAGGWVITSSDQVGGFISAELIGQRRTFFGSFTEYRAFVSIALVDRGNGTTSVNLSVNTHEEAGRLAQAIRERLGI